MAPRITLTIRRFNGSGTVLDLHMPGTRTSTASTRRRRSQTGIDTCHLSRAHLRVWRSILDIVMAKDKEGRRLHPTLYGLYRQADSSGHVIRIDLSDEESLHPKRCQFNIETLDPKGASHVTTIRLNLATIERAYVGESTRYSNGLIPFAGLRTKQRYAEVLGHELAHAATVFQCAESLRLYQQIEKEAADLDAGDVNETNRDWLMRLESVKRLMSQSEELAEAAELEIWRELQGGTSPNPRLSTGKRNSAGSGAFAHPLR